MWAEGLRPPKSRLGERSEAPRSRSAPAGRSSSRRGRQGSSGRSGPARRWGEEGGGEARASPPASRAGGCLRVGTAVVPCRAAARARVCRGTGVIPVALPSSSPRARPRPGRRRRQRSGRRRRRRPRRAVAVLSPFRPPSAVPPARPAGRRPRPSSPGGRLRARPTRVGPSPGWGFPARLPARALRRAAEGGRWVGRRETAAAPAVQFLGLRPQIRRGDPLNLSILVSGGKETNEDSLSNGE